MYLVTLELYTSVLHIECIAGVARAISKKYENWEFT